MGRFTGFLSGLTLTTSALYLSLLLHQRNRTHQASLLHQQSLLLHSILDPDIVPVEETPRHVLRRETWTETWKDRWNAEVESAVRGVQRTDWRTIREGAERRWREWREGERRT
ncbi:hypothetical protein MMC25_006921 [Agyrium rufum]|nr:hypothetical protein [Agyrium rufum]